MGGMEVVGRAGGGSVLLNYGREVAGANRAAGAALPVQAV